MGLLRHHLDLAKMKLDLKAIWRKSEAEGEAKARLMYPEGPERDKCAKEFAHRYYMQRISPF